MNCAICLVYFQDLEDECNIHTSSSKRSLPWKSYRRQSLHEIDKQWKSVIILIPLRLGSEKLNLAYAHCLKLLLSTEYCIGIIGGRPKHSLYFLGFQGLYLNITNFSFVKKNFNIEDKLIHLDPHYCQEMVDVSQESFPLQSFHCKSPRKLKTSKIDPSCCIGFYCQTKTDYQNFVESVQIVSTMSN